MQRICNFILCDNVLLPSSLCMGKFHLKIRSHKRGFIVGFEEDLCHEYE